MKKFLNGGTSDTLDSTWILVIVNPNKKLLADAT